MADSPRSRMNAGFSESAFAISRTIINFEVCVGCLVVSAPTRPSYIPMILLNDTCAAYESPLRWSSC
jgi:hypothetical protein